jgi:hypothetical protein
LGFGQRCDRAGTDFFGDFAHYFKRVFTVPEGRHREFNCIEWQR